MATSNPWAPSDALGAALHLLRMRATFYCRTEVSAPWALGMPSIGDSVSFHLLIEGRCWVELPDGDPLEMGPGDLVLVPHGLGHVVASSAGVRPAARVDHLPQEYVGEHYSVLRYGGGGDASRLVCGVVSFDDPAARSLTQALPRVLHVEAGGAQADSIIGTVRLMAAELVDLRPGGEAVVTRLADILVIQGIRHWLERAGSSATGWIAALRDERVGRALAAVHCDPGVPWTLERLAREASMSRSSFAARFRELAGEPAMTYVTRWRMQVAHARLEAGDATVAQLAGQLGYLSEAAFTRAFARVHGTTPGAVRRRLHARSDERRGDREAAERGDAGDGAYDVGAVPAPFERGTFFPGPATAVGEAIVERHVDRPGHRDGEQTHGDTGAAPHGRGADASGQLQRERRDASEGSAEEHRQEPAVEDGDVDRSHGRDEGPVVDAVEPGHDGTAEGEEQPGDEAGRESRGQQRGALELHRPPPQA
jgi:AraC-like DNA-binding protein